MKIGSPAGLVLATVVGVAAADGPLQHVLPGNPSTGYRWVLNEAASTGRDLVRVEVIGYGAPETDLIGAPAPFSFAVFCTGSGQAVLQFDYLSPSGTTVGDTDTLRLHCP